MISLKSRGGESRLSLPVLGADETVEVESAGEKFRVLRKCADAGAAAGNQAGGARASRRVLGYEVIFKSGFQSRGGWVRRGSRGR